MPVRNSIKAKKKNTRKERCSRGYSAGLMKDQICQMITEKAFTRAIDVENSREEALSENEAGGAVENV